MCAPEVFVTTPFSQSLGASRGASPSCAVWPAASQRRASRANGNASPGAGRTMRLRCRDRRWRGDLRSLLDRSRAVSPTSVLAAKPFGERLTVLRIAVATLKHRCVERSHNLLGARDARNQHHHRRGVLLIQRRLGAAPLIAR